MAIVFEKEHRTVNWVRLIFWIFILGFTVFAVYYLFLAPTPKLDVVLPAPLEQLEKFQTVKFTDPKDIFNAPVFRGLKLYAGPPVVGALGRPNPFQPL